MPPSNRPIYNTNEVEEYIRAYIRDAEDATNRHDFSPTSIPWSTPAVTQHNIESLVIGEPQTMNIHDFLQLWSTIAERNPGWKIHVVDSMVMVNAKNGFAEAYLNMETIDAPQGVTKPAVVKMVWKLFKGDWVVTSVRQLDGVDAS